MPFAALAELTVRAFPIGFTNLYVCVAPAPKETVLPDIESVVLKSPPVGNKYVLAPGCEGRLVPVPPSTATHGE